jgi:hypothetical protein
VSSDEENDNVDEFADCTDTEGTPADDHSSSATDLVKVEVSKVLNVSWLILDHSCASSKCSFSSFNRYWSHAAILTSRLTVSRRQRNSVTLNWKISGHRALRKRVLFWKALQLSGFLQVLLSVCVPFTSLRLFLHPPKLKIDFSHIKELHESISDWIFRSRCRRSSRTHISHTWSTSLATRWHIRVRSLIWTPFLKLKSAQPSKFSSNILTTS